MIRLLVIVIALTLSIPISAIGADKSEIQQRIEVLSNELEQLKQQIEEMKKKEASKEERLTSVEQKGRELTWPSWLEIGGDFRARYDYLSGKTHDALLMTPSGNISSGARTLTNDSLLTNRLGLNITAKATEDIKVKARLLMYKVWGSNSDAVTGESGYFADKQDIFDGNMGHTPDSSTLRVDQVVATWSNIGGEPLSFSVGRRPSTGGLPTNLRRNVENTSGVPGYMVDWAFDGATVGYMPEIDLLPGAQAKICYGKGFDSGFQANGGLKDTNLLGLHAVPYDNDNLRFDLLWLRAFNIFARAETISSNTNLGDVDQFGILVMKKFEDLGNGDLHLFAGTALSLTHPNENTYNGYGLLWDSGTERKNRTGALLYLGGRYDFKSTATKVGLEYNRGSKYWLSFTPASDDILTSKLGTRGNAYEAYIIQEIKSKPISKFGKAFVRLGYQYYDFEYSGSQNWVGAPYEVSGLTLTSTPAQFFQPLANAHNVYFTFDVLF